MDLNANFSPCRPGADGLFCLAKTFESMIFSLPSLYFFPFLALLSVCWSDQVEAMTETPSSPNSQEVRERLTPEIEELMAKKGMFPGQPIFIRIFKESAELEIWVRQGITFKIFKTYTICDYSGSLGPKEREGDKQSPEGFYQVGVSQLNPWSKFHLAFDLGYPNAYDRACGRTGKSLMVHGRCSSVGCYAMTDYRMEEIYTLADAALAHGQGAFEVHIFPFRMTKENMQQHQGDPWYSFWQNLQEGYDLFERTLVPPLVTVDDNRYTFNPTTIQLSRHP